MNEVGIELLGQLKTADLAKEGTPYHVQFFYTYYNTVELMSKAFCPIPIHFGCSAFYIWSLDLGERTIVCLTYVISWQYFFCFKAQISYQQIWFRFTPDKNVVLSEREQVYLSFFVCHERALIQ